MKRGSKKGVSHKKSSPKEKVTRIIHESARETNIERALIENFIALQKVMVNLSAKFDNLSSQISKLLELFEISAKSLAKGEFEDVEKENKYANKIMEKIDNLTQQTNLIGRGLALIHESNSEQPSPEKQIPLIIPKKPFGQITPMDEPRTPMSLSMPDYKESMLSKVSEINE